MHLGLSIDDPILTIVFYPLTDVSRQVMMPAYLVPL